MSFHVNKGEVLGIAGLVGSGSTEMMEALFGLRPYTRGTIVFDGRLVRNIKRNFSCIQELLHLMREV